MTKRAMISGGAGGLGKAVVSAFLENGYEVLILHRNPAKYAQVKRACGDLTEKLSGYELDLSDEAQLAELFASNLVQTPFSDIIHLAGGFWMGGTIGETSFKDWQRMHELNLHTTFLLARAAQRHFLSHKGGHILTITAKPALELPAGMGAYAVSKAAALALNEVLVKEGAGKAIRVNTILPGIIDTPANRQAMPDANTRTWVKAEEIAAMIIAVCQNPSVSGAQIKMYLHEGMN
jgi:NAD(P)-dependent dehydrogenase (short-subunit alcohol dehydrogenase family)